MDDTDINIDQTESWEDSIEKDSSPKLKYPVELRDLQNLSFCEPENVSYKIPKSRSVTKTSVINLGKKSKKDKNKLF